MGYAEMRMQREVQQLKRDAQLAKNRERQTRQGCLDLLDAMKEIVTSLEGSNVTASAKAAELVAQAGACLAPDPDGE